MTRYTHHLYYCINHVIIYLYCLYICIFINYFWQWKQILAEIKHVLNSLVYIFLTNYHELYIIEGEISIECQNALKTNIKNSVNENQNTTKHSS